MSYKKAGDLPEDRISYSPFSQFHPFPNTTLSPAPPFLYLLIPPFPSSPPSPHSNGPTFRQPHILTTLHPNSLIFRQPHITTAPVDHCLYEFGDFFHCSFHIEEDNSEFCIFSDECCENCIFAGVHEQHITILSPDEDLIQSTSV